MDIAKAVAYAIGNQQTGVRLSPFISFRDITYPDISGYHNDRYRSFVNVGCCLYPSVPSRLGICTDHSFGF